MPRARLLKPGFFKNPTLARLSTTHRLTYAGLWTLADREGRLEDSPERIRVDVFPYEPKIDLEPILKDLHETGFIRRYRSGSRRIIQIPRFLVHQTPHFKEPASEFPPPKGHQDSGIIAFGVPPDQRLRILERDRYRCVRCGAGDSLSIDHIKPRTRGGTGDDANLQTLCKRCNSKKGNRDEVVPSPAKKQAENEAKAPVMNEPSMDHSPTVGSPDPVPEAETVPEAEAETETESVSNTPKSSAADAARHPQRRNGTAEDTPAKNVGIITKIAHEVIDLIGPTATDLQDTVKGLCAKRHIAYDSTTVNGAIDSALHQRAHRHTVGGS